MDDEEARTIGEQLRRIRKSRRKSLRVIAGLAGMSASSLSRMENGLRALDSRSEIAALADALQIAPSELTKLPVPAPANGGVAREGPAGSAADLLAEAVTIAERTGADRTDYELVFGRAT